MNKDVKVITEENLEYFLFQNRAQYFGIPDMKFQYEIGDHVTLKAMATPQGRIENAIPGFKRSLGKFFKHFICISYIYKQNNTTTSATK